MCQDAPTCIHCLTNPCSTSGNCLDKGIDMGAIVDPSQRKSVDAFVKKAREEGANVFQKCACIPDTGCYYPPTLITNVQPVSTVVQEEVGGACVT